MRVVTDGGSIAARDAAVVLTDRMGIDGTRERSGHTRRRLLGSAALAATAATTAGCGLFDEEPRPVPPPDPLAPVLADALALAGLHDQAAAAQPGLARRLNPLAEAHRAHAAELTRVMGAAAPGSAPASAPAAPSSGDSGGALKSLRAAEQAAQRAAAALCQQIPGQRAALVGSIAAARASHAEALR